ncbi:MAG: DUF4202 domain-containing protein [Actinomycetota bacterium]|nr:DUF4202 domain-containing protein [Actinomycetota bacterium]
MSERFDAAIAAIDAANADDPFTIEIDGVVRPKEQAHAELMTEWVRRLDPDATEAQLIAARAHHLRRWTIPRASYPEGRAGYLRWRATLKKQHAEEVGAILSGVGYDAGVIDDVQRIIRKEGLGSELHGAVQVHEDALCLVFLQTQLASTTDQLGDDHMISVIQKTVAKMSPAGLAHVATIEMRDHDRDLVARALAPG